MDISLTCLKRSADDLGGHILKKLLNVLMPVLSLIVVLIAASALPVRANHIVSTYRQRGYFIPATGTSFAIATTSDNCNARELAAYNRVATSTTGATWIQGRWPQGINIYRNSGDPCNGNVTRGVDIFLDYQPRATWDANHSTNAGGENHSSPAPQSFCDYWRVNSPCGSHPSTVHVNWDKWGTTSDLGKERLIMHETGHSLGLDHHCTSDSIMNQGSADCNGGRWLEVMVYKETDREGINKVYPNWRYN